MVYSSVLPTSPPVCLPGHPAQHHMAGAGSEVWPVQTEHVMYELQRTETGAGAAHANSDAALPAQATARQGTK